MLGQGELYINDKIVPCQFDFHRHINTDTRTKKTTFEGINRLVIYKDYTGLHEITDTFKLTIMFPGWLTTLEDASFQTFQMTENEKCFAMEDVVVIGREVL